ncbi:phosphatase 2C-like domain-containing protein [Cryomyces antarcticus]|nr:hypothetical protein LTR04_005906 [Oleoguttula sp. CCFEE 6159]
MFGTSGSPPKEDIAVDPNPLVDPKSPSITIPSDANSSSEKRMGESKSPSGGKSMDESSPSGEKKRRSSGVAKARDMFSSAKQSFRDHTTSPMANPERSQQAEIRRLGKIDPALSVPQGSFNNSAGESVAGPRSTFRVGVTEDKNKKCRRTMEDTHAYLYNFLSTPAPSLASDSTRSSTRDSTSTLTENGSQSVVETDNGYFAIFDGHAGTFAADWCGKKVHLLLEDIIRKNPNTPIPELLDQTFTSVDQQLERLPVKNSGCTAVIAVLRWEDRVPNMQSATGSTPIAPAAAAAVKAAEPPISKSPPLDAPGSSLTHNDVSAVLSPLSETRSGPPTVAKLAEAALRQRVLYTANVGDARIVLCRNGKALRLSYDHKGSDENEGRRVASAGGLILNNRVNGVLAVTRALGDAYMKDLVTGHPYTTETVIQPDVDEFLILACDGLWDVCTDQEAVDLVRHTQDPQHASRLLVEHALTRFSTDNLSCMVVRFDNKAVQDTVKRIAEPIGVDGDPPTTRGGLSEAEAIVLQSRKKLDETEDDQLEKVPSDVIREESEEPEPGPELNLEAPILARKS